MLGVRCCPRQRLTACLVLFVLFLSSVIVTAQGLSQEVESAQGAENSHKVETSQRAENSHKVETSQGAGNSQKTETTQGAENSQKTETPPPIFPLHTDGKYLIRTAHDLAKIQSQADLYVASSGREGSLDYLSADYLLAADIFLPKDFTPIGNAAANPRFVFSGSLDGAGFCVREMEIISSRGVTHGLFGKTHNAHIKNLTITGAEVHAVGDYGNSEFAVGLLVGEALGGRLENITIAHAEISAAAPDEGNGAVGALAGKAIGTSLKNINVSDIQITADGGLRAVGGAAGYLEACTAESVTVLNGKIAANALATGGFAGKINGGAFTASGAELLNIAANGNIGGFVGLVTENAFFRLCNAQAKISGTQNGVAGGFAGRINGAEATSDKGALPLSSDWDVVGISPRSLDSLLASKPIGTEILDCRAICEIGALPLSFDLTGIKSGEIALAGGFVGRLAGRSRIASSHASGYVIADCSGGFVSEITNSSRIEYSSTTAAVFGREIGAGFAAIISDIGVPNTITNSLAAGKIAASDKNARRFAGVARHDGINGCYAYLGMVTLVNGTYSHAIPNPFSNDGGDIVAFHRCNVVGMSSRASGAYKIKNNGTRICADLTDSRGFYP